MPSNCIYEVFKWMGITIKYTGTIPLPGLYENKKMKEDSKGKRFLFSILLPLLLWGFCAFGCFDVIKSGLSVGTEDNLADILCYLIIAIYVVNTVLYPPVYYFRMSGKLVTYLELHANIDQLIKPHQHRLKLIANSLLILGVTINIFDSLIYSYVRYSDVNDGQHAMQETFALINFLYYATCFFYQPQIMYVAFQHVLKCAFQELLKRIQEEKKAKNGSVEDVRKKLRMYGTLYRSLCRLGKRLDDMTSPLIVHQFLYRFVLLVQAFTFLTFSLSLETFTLALESISSAIVVVYVPFAAHETKNAASKIVSAAYLSFDLNDKEIAKEMQMFAAQLFQFQVDFSASGLFQLDKNLIQNIIQSIISQWVIFFKIHKEKIEEEQSA